MRKTKIICTLGPSVEDINVLEQLILSGMDCARLNFSHGTHEEHLKRINDIKYLRDKLDSSVAILLDTKGPEIRLKDFKNGFVDLKKGETFTFLPDASFLGDEHSAGLSYPHLALDVNVDTIILVDDGKVAFVIREIINGALICEILNDGRIGNHKSINVPNVAINMEYLSLVDKKDLLFGIEHDVDFVAASFVRTADDVKELRRFLNENKGENIKIISKIENIQGISNMDDIIAESDGIMIARGDLGVEIPFNELPIIQKDLIKRCYKAGKYVVTATQMLESMTKNPRPTRAEVSDVANAIFDGSTIIMLSGETAAGDYPVESLKTMVEIAISTEESIDYPKRFSVNKLMLGGDISNAIANTACSASYQTNSKALLVVTKSGETANLVACYKPQCPIIAAVIEKKGARQLQLAWNVKPVKALEWGSVDEIFEHGIEQAIETGLVLHGDTIVMVGGSSVGDVFTDMLKIHKV